MSETIRIAGKTFKIGSSVYYNSYDTKIKCEISGVGRDANNKLFLQIIDKTTNQTYDVPEEEIQKKISKYYISGKKIKDTIKKTGSAIKKGVGTAFSKIGEVELNLSRIQLEIIMFLAVVAHIIDWQVFKFSIDAHLIPYRILLYGVLIFCTILVTGEIKQFFQLFIKFGKPALVVVILIPVIAYLIEMIGASEEILKLIAGFTLMLPIYAMYLLWVSGFNYELPGETGLQKFFNALVLPSGWVRLITIGVMLVIIISTFTIMADLAEEGSTMAGISGSGFEPSEALKGATQILMTPLNKLIERIKAVGPVVNATINKAYNETLGEYYVGQVEQNKEQTGAFITELTSSGAYTNIEPVKLFATLKMRSFVDSINITPGCYATDLRNETRKIYGTTDPPKIENVYRDDYQGVICTFDAGKLTEGSYDITFTAEFNFETWSYSIISLMDRDIYNSLQINNEFKRQELQRQYNIKPFVRSEYTSGPVMLGVNDRMDLPVLVTTRDAVTPTFIPLGVTIDDLPQQGGARGEILRVNSFRLIAPQGFTINRERCVIPGGGDMKVDYNSITNYNNYYFNVSKTPGKYLTVSCIAQITPLNARTMLGELEKLDVSVIGVVTYDYVLTRRTEIKVTKTG